MSRPYAVATSGASLWALLRRREQCARQPRCMDHGGRFICEDGSHAPVSRGPAWAVEMNQDLYVGLSR